MLVPQQMYFVGDSRATLDGVDLRSPRQLRDNPRIGDVSLPARGVLAIGQGVGESLDKVEYERTRSETSQQSSVGSQRQAIANAGHVVRGPATFSGSHQSSGVNHEEETFTTGRSSTRGPAWLP